MDRKTAVKDILGALVGPIVWLILLLIVVGSHARGEQAPPATADRASADSAITAPLRPAAGCELPAAYSAPAARTAAP